MKSMLFRTGSGPIPVQAPATSASPRLSVSVFVSLHAEASRRSIRRSASESNVTRSEMRTLSRQHSRLFSSLRMPEVENEDCGSDAWDWAEGWEELGSPGGGMNKNRKSGGGSGGVAERSDVGAYYRQMIKSSPTNSLLLRNYGRYLHEVEGNVVKAEEYYGRSILAGPGDGEVLSLYGKLIWETQRDESRAKSYFTQAIQASPDNCMVLGSYAHFLWEADDEECRDDEEMETEVVPIPTMLEAF